MEVVKEKKTLNLREDLNGHPVTKEASCQPPAAIFGFVNLAN
jgi:hypothetical protein